MRFRKPKEITFSINEKGCHICTSHILDRGGYPRINYNGERMQMSHYLWEKEHGPIPEGMRILHKCDNPSCINVDHFFLGTLKDNTVDMLKKGRHVSRFTKELILEIREAPGTMREIGKRYDIDSGEVSRIKNRKRWGWL